jgi:hypothetical protein
VPTPGDRAALVVDFLHRDVGHEAVRGGNNVVAIQADRVELPAANRSWSAWPSRTPARAVKATIERQKQKASSYE